MKMAKSADSVGDNEADVELVGKSVRRPNEDSKALVLGKASAEGNKERRRVCFRLQSKRQINGQKPKLKKGDWETTI